MKSLRPDLKLPEPSKPIRSLEKSKLPEPKSNRKMNKISERNPTLLFSMPTIGILLSTEDKPGLSTSMKPTVQLALS